MGIVTHGKNVAVKRRGVYCSGMKKKYSNKQKTEERLFVTRGTRISDTKKREHTV